MTAIPAARVVQQVSIYGSKVDESIQTACEALKFTLPVKSSLIKLPQNEEGPFSINSAAVMFLDMTSAQGPSIPMVRQIKKKEKVLQWDGTYSTPGGKIAKIKEGFKANQVCFEKYFPLLTGSRELYEELPIFKDLNEAYTTINQEDTQVLTNTSWNSYPVATYLVNCNPDLSARISKLANSSFKTEETSGVIKVPLSHIHNAFKTSGWTTLGFNHRSKLLAQPKAIEGQSDFSSVKQFDENLTVELPSKEKIKIASYVARTLFLQSEKISQAALLFSGLVKPAESKAI